MAQAATPRRTSARLKNISNQPQTPASTTKLSVLVERGETPDRTIAPNLGAIAASAPPKTAAVQLPSNAISTPSTRIKPDAEEMHPSKYHSAIKKQAEPGPAANPFSSPTFEFRFNRPSTELSSEAQKLMGEVRERAVKIKSQLCSSRLDGTADLTVDPAGHRKVSNPKGKLSRFSDVHLEQFKKMASIANHPSSFRATGTPSNPSSPAKSLKRSNSQANLDKPNDGIAHSPSTKSVRSITLAEPNSSPLKRTKSVTKTPQQSPGVATPTKASLARAESVKSAKSERTKIPKLISSPSSKSIATPRALKPTIPNTDGKIRSSFASKLNGGVRSILRRPQLKFSDDPVRIAAGTHVSTPQKQSAESAGALLVPGEKTPGSPCNRQEKRVNFCDSPTSKVPSSPAATPSPTKRDIKYPVLPDVQGQIGTPTRNSHFANDTARALVTAPIDFTFRAGHQISFSPPKSTTPATATSPTIRPVRNSSVVDVVADVASNKTSISSLPHGLSNKKRKRDSPIPEFTQEDKENEPVAESPTKKVKVLTRPAPAVKSATPAAPAARKPQEPKSKTAVKQKGRGILSLSRLNALARPKNRG